MGHLVIGFEEAGGVASALQPLTGLDVDEEQLRLEAIVRSGIEPPIVGLRVRRISVPGGDVIIMHVPRSHNPPYRVIFRNSNRYYSRSSASVYELSMEELRRLFGEQRTIEEQARTFMGERFLRIQAGEAAMPLPAGKGITVIHLIPLPDFGAKRQIDIATMNEHRLQFCPIRAMGFSHRINLDGLVTYHGGSDFGGYTQLFRNGSLEAVSTDLIVEDKGSRVIPSQAFARTIIDSVSAYISGLRVLDLSPPILMKITFSSMIGVGFLVDRHRFLPPPTYERETLHLPHAVLSEYRDDGTYEALVAEQMDFLERIWFQEMFPIRRTGHLACLKTAT